MKMITKEKYWTSDFHLATTLLACGCPVLELDATDARRVKFGFIKTIELNRLVGEFWAGNISINPKILFNAQKELKARLYASY